MKKILACCLTICAGIAVNSPIINTALAAPQNLISNYSLEAASANLNIPQDWFQGGWGTNTRNFTYPVAGNALTVPSAAAKVEITSYTNGDAKWFFKEVSIVPGQTYTFSNWYQSNVQSLSSIRFTMIDGSFKYLDVSLTIPPSEGWKNVNKTFVVPANVVSLTVFHVIKQVGF